MHWHSFGSCLLNWNSSCVVAKTGPLDIVGAGYLQARQCQIIQWAIYSEITSISASGCVYHLQSANLLAAARTAKTDWNARCSSSSESRNTQIAGVESTVILQN